MAQRLPILLAADEQQVRTQLNNRRERARAVSYAFPFDRDERDWLMVSFAAYRENLANADWILSYCATKIRPASPDQFRRDLWYEVIVRKFTRAGSVYHHELWHTVLVRWLLRGFTGAGAQRYLAGDRTMCEAFFQDAVGIEDDGLSHRDGDLFQRNYCKAYIPTRQLQEFAIELQLERSQDELLAEFGPRFLLLLAQAWPPARVVSLGALIVEALINFTSFMFYLEDAQADGDVTDEELKEAYWQFAGIVPFRIVQLALLGRAVVTLGPELISMLMDAVRDYYESLETRRAAFDAGWTGYASAPPGKMTFISEEQIRRLTGQ